MVCSDTNVPPETNLQLTSLELSWSDLIMADLKRKMEEDSDLVTFAVGGVTFVLKKDVIDQYPDSFLANIIKPKWRCKDDEPIVIKRDGTLFQYIYDYLRYGALPRDKSGQLMVDASTKAEILQEADFYQLGGLVKECLQEDGYQIGYDTQWLLYNAFKETIKHCKNGKYLGGGCKRKWVVPGDVPDTPRHRMQMQNTITRSQTSSETYLAFTKLLRQITAPCCMHGKVDAKDLSGMNVPNVSKSVDERCLKEWLANTTSENTFYSAVHPTTKRRVCTAGAYGIDLSMMKQEYFEIVVRPYMFEVCEDGLHHEIHVNTPRKSEQIGMLALILNSEYTGGELEVTHNGHTEVVTGPYSWVAMYGDCLHQINPVTSGKCVTLYCDLFPVESSPILCSENHLRNKLTVINQSCVCSVMLRSADEAQKQKLIEGMHEQLRDFDSAVICLQHLYPACQANPDFLKGGDQLLYDILRDHFTLAVLPCTIYRNNSKEDWYRGSQKLYRVEPLALANVPEADAAQVAAAAALKTNFIIFNKFIAQDQVALDEPIGDRYDLYARETLYLVAGLQVRRRETKDT